MKIITTLVYFITTITLFSSSSQSKLTKPINFTTFKEESDRPFFNFTKYASIDGGALQLTPDNENQQHNGYFNKSGRITFHKPFDLWPTSNDDNETVVSFNTTFVLNIYRNKIWNPGEGLAFVISPGFDLPPESHGQWLGLTNATTDGDPRNSLVAVEFDTEKQGFDPDDNHIGLNINSVKSYKTVSMNEHGFLLSPENGTDYRVWVGYNGGSKLIEVYIANRTDPKPEKPVLREALNLRDHVKRTSYFGFSGSTGDPGSQYNCVLEWEMEIETFPAKRDTKWIKIGAGVGVSIVIVVGFLGVKLGLYVKKRKRARDEEEEESNVVGSALKRLAGMPREFRFKELKKATEGFKESMVLGRGGFGIVYRGVLCEKEDNNNNNIIINSNVSCGTNHTIQVAVKMFSRDYIKRKDDFLAELTIIHRLRHKHLVRLVGWCHEKKKLLLVYDYMPNGSLDKHLYDSSATDTLNSTHRNKILAGVASALHYLHNDFDQKVVHRDLKASNVLLDSDFNARLGDFGLARAIEDERNSYAELGLGGVPGTMGYVAPECFHTGKATPESDVFGFGAVVLEVVCGRSPAERIVQAEHSQVTLVDWVWLLHREGRICDAVDVRLGDGYVTEEARRLLLLGLACSSPVAGERPLTRDICHIIAETLPPPRVPPFKPVFMWPALGFGFDFSSVDSGLSNLTFSSGNVKNIES